MFRIKIITNLMIFLNLMLNPKMNSKKIYLPNMDLDKMIGVSTIIKIRNSKNNNNNCHKKINNNYLFSNNNFKTNLLHKKKKKLNKT
jgi:hypothetical protein